MSETSILYYNGQIETMANNHKANAMIVENGVITAIGSENLCNDFPVDNFRVNLEGKTVLPSFIDAHCHFGIGTVAPLWANYGEINSDCSQTNEWLRIKQPSQWF